MMIAPSKSELDDLIHFRNYAVRKGKCWRMTSALTTIFYHQDSSHE